MSVTRWLGAATFVALTATTAGAQEIPRSTAFRYTNFHLVLSPDSGGIYLWANSGEAGGPKTEYSAVFNPADALAWVSDARWFLDQRIPSSDSGSSKNSPALRGLEESGRIYIVRRRDGLDWTKERFLVLEPKDPKANALIVNADERSIRAILDSVEIVGRRAPPFDPRIHGDSIKPDQPARLKPGQRPPAYPGNARLENREGLVAVRFVIGVDGKADMSTVRVIASPGEPFHKAVLSALPRLRFEPAKLRGAPVRQLVVMPFDFSLLRRP